jgi:hypothetical protein
MNAAAKWSTGAMLACLYAASGPAAAAGEVPAVKPAEGRKPPACFILADGSRVYGETSVREIAIKTAYGEVAVPASEVVLMRVARSSDQQTRERAAALIRQLGAASFEERERAADELYKLGASALGQLREALKSPDAEICGRVEKLLEDLDRGPDEEDAEDSGPLFGDEDEVVTRRFTLRGVIKVEKFDLKTRYGALEIPREQVISASLAKPDMVTKTFRVQAAHHMGGMLDTRLRFKAGDRVLIRASGSITFHNYSEACGPEGQPNRFGNYRDGIPGMSLAGRVGASAEPFLVGASKSFTAETDGELYLAVASNGSPGRTTGEYRVRVTVTPKQR